MSQPDADREKNLRHKREKNRIAQQRHREKKKNSTAKLMVTLQNVKLAATRNDINRIQELVKSPSILLPRDSTSANTSLPLSGIVEFPVRDGSFSPPQNPFEPAVLPQGDRLGNLMTHDFLHPSLSPFPSDLANTWGPFEACLSQDTTYMLGWLPLATTHSSWEIA